MMRHSPPLKVTATSIAKATAMVTACGLVFELVGSAAAIPVYLNLDSRFPSGHHSRQALENRTKKVQFQRWLRVETADHVMGWIAEDHCVTTLRLAATATVLDTLPVRNETQMDAITHELIAKGTKVAVDESLGSWAKVRFHTGGGETHESWVPSDNLQAELPPAGTALTQQKVFIAKDAPIYILPGLHARTQGKIPAGQIRTVVRDHHGWLEISTRRDSAFAVGYLNRKDVISVTDLGNRGARTMIELAPLRSAPLPYANLERNLPLASDLKITGSDVLRWGMARVTDIGEIWWPMADGLIDEEKDGAHPELISSDELFRRKIFDMASSPAIPSLKFVSAQGVYRTLDGHQWTKLATFENKNYPIAIAGLGSIFVGPYISDDHGETFQQWIRWDSLVAVLRRNSKVTPQNLQIQEIKPEDPTGRRVILKLAIGKDATVRLLTEDQGLSWRTTTH